MRKAIAILQIIFLLTVFAACSTETPQPEEEATIMTEVEIEPSRPTQLSEPEEQQTEASEPEIPEPLEPYDPVANNFMPRQDPFFEVDGQPMLTKEQVLEDYEYLWKMLEENLPYYDEIGTYVGKNLLMVKDDHLKKIEEVKSDWISLTLYKSLFENALDEFRSVGHVHLIQSETHKNLLLTDYQTNANSSGKDANAFRQLVDIATNHKTVTYYQKLKNSTASDIGRIHLSADINPSVLSYFNQNISLGEKEGIPYIKIKTFEAPDGLYDEYLDYSTDELQAFLPQHIDSPHIIIDIRGNSGGSNDIWTFGIVSPFPTQEAMSYRRTIGIRSSMYNDLLFAGVASDVPQNFDESLLEGKEFDIILQSGSSWDVGNPPAVEVYNGQIWLLVDEWVYSASERFAVVCKQTGYATLVGTQTGGNGGSYVPFVFALPNSGALVAYDATYVFNDDGTCNQIYGTKPDIDSGGRDALAVCLEEIAKLEN